jgi:hypothetical protein
MFSLCEARSVLWARCVESDSVTAPGGAGDVPVGAGEVPVGAGEVPVGAGGASVETGGGVIAAVGRCEMGLNEVFGSGGGRAGLTRVAPAADGGRLAGRLPLGPPPSASPAKLTREADPGRDPSRGAVRFRNCSKLVIDLSSHEDPPCRLFQIL